MRLLCPSAVTRIALIGALFVTAACDETEPSTPAQIVGVPGQSVAGRAGESVPVTVRVTASNNRPLEGQVVTFAPTTGSVAQVTVSTDAAGQATTNWTLGPTVGTQTLNVSVGSLTPLTISATVTSGRPAAIAIQAGDNQTATVGQAVATRPSVVVRDAGGNPVPNANVVFAAASGGGSVAGAVVTTDAQGVATVGTWTLGPTAGPNTLTAEVIEAGTTQRPIVTFTATGVAATASRVTAARGNGATGTAGTPLAAANLPAVLVTDATGNPVQGVAVTFQVTSGGGTITAGGTQTTNALGVATLGGFTLGQTVGPNVITATAGAAGSTAFTIAGQAGPAARVELVGGNNQEARAGSALPLAPTVRVVDQFGNPVQGTTVTFVATGGGASILGSTQTTNAEGRASAGGVNLGATPGTNTFEARVQGLQPVRFTATGLAGAPAFLRPIVNDTVRLVQDTVRVTAFEQSTPFVVEVRDGDGFPVRGATVTFTVDSAKAGTLAPATATTDASGRASSRLTAGAVVDTAVITATLGTLPPVTFIAVIGPNAPATVTAVQGGGQSATAGTRVSQNPTVEVRDGRGRPVAGARVAFAIVAGGGGLLPPEGAVMEGNAVIVLTGTDGRAGLAGWQLGGNPGENILTAVVQAAGVAGNPVRFTAQGIAAPGAGTTIVVVQGNAQTVGAGNFVPVPPQVQVRNAAGQPLAGVTVEFIPSFGSQVNGSTASVTVQTNANGIAALTSWRLSTQPGLNSLTAAVVGAGVSVQFTATGQ